MSPTVSPRTWTVSGLRQKDPELLGILGKAPGLLGRIFSTGGKPP